MQIEEGKYYVTSVGYVAGPMIRSYDPAGFYVAQRGVFTGHIWQANGKCGQKSSFTLVREARDDEAPSALKLTEPQNNSEGRKDDKNKSRIDLIAPEFITQVADVLSFGAGKYAPRNWEKGMSWGRCFAALMRHMWAWWGGEQKDAETGLSHLAHAACCLMFLMAYEKREIGTDDRKTA